MTPLTLNGHELLVVEVPEGANGICISSDNYLEGYSPAPTNATDDQLRYWGEKEWLFSDTELPSGTWHILGPSTADRCSDRDWSQVLEKENDGSDSLRPWWYHLIGTGCMTKSAKEAGDSWLRSQGYSELNRIVVIVKDKV